MNRVYGKFDQLCEHHGIYKLDILGDNYFAMGFTGKKSLLTRSDDDIYEEAAKTILVAFQMSEVICLISFFTLKIPKSKLLLRFFEFFGSYL